MTVKDLKDILSELPDNMDIVGPSINEPSDFIVFNKANIRVVKATKWSKYLYSLYEDHKGVHKVKRALFISKY